MTTPKEFIKIPAVFMRGGTSKGVYLMARDLPDDPAGRDRVILDIFGSPDVRQINGMGGADPLTSKVAILAPSKRAGVDIDYTFGYVGIRKRSLTTKATAATSRPVSVSMPFGGVSSNRWNR